MLLFLDEKGFYTRSNRKKAKLLPKGANETEEPQIPTVTLVSCRHAAKVMYLGVVSCPIPGKFDGKIHLERVSKKAKYKKKTHNEQFSEEVGINESIKEGWKKEVHSGMTASELASHVGADFGLAPDIIERIVFRYKSGTTKKSKVE